ncbi:MAG TPA: hypothetical protein P5244_01435 [Syntrophales bacterium]|nr:hypothetical protein [Syntrophales bacterium]
MVSEKLSCTASKADDEVVDIICKAVLEAATIPCGMARCTAGKLEKNDFSICFPLDLYDVNGRTKKRSLYVKIPKDDLYKRREREIMPLTDRDRTSGRKEYESLLFLNSIEKTWGDGLEFVKPVLFFDDYNAIVTERVFGRDLLIPFRKEVLKDRILHLQCGTFIRDSLFLLGRVVSAYHRRTQREISPDWGKVFEKIEKYGTLLKNYSSADDLPVLFQGLRRSMEEAIPRSVTVKTLKGLDVRNVLIDEAGGMVVLDPGRMKDDCPEADLARFIVTCRIIFWGSMWFFIRLTPDAAYEGSFLEGYKSYGGKFDQKLLRVHIIKELAKHWYLAHVALDLKNWSYVLKKMLRAIYINPFYKFQLMKEVLYAISA